MIEVRNVSKTYQNSVKALKQIDFKINTGEITGIIGRNGAGKSTLFKIICGLITEYEGESIIFGQKSSISLSHRISYLPEVRGLDSRMYVMEHLIELVMYKGIRKKEAQASLEKWLKEFNLYDNRYRKISALSKGNQQRLQLIASIATNPEILILDEPFSGLDLITIDYFWSILLQLRDQGCTIMFSTHDLNDNLLNCNQLLFLNEGILKESGPLIEIQNHFDLILELKNKTAEEEVLKRIAGADNTLKQGDEFYIRMTDDSVAHRIFDNLEDKFCEKFYIRKMNIPEIFREISR